MYDFGKETCTEKSQAQEDLQARNADYYAQQQVRKERFLAEQAKKQRVDVFKRIPKPNDVLYERKRSLKGGSIILGPCELNRADLTYGRSGQYLVGCSLICAVL